MTGTATTPLGYATKQNRWLEWAVAEEGVPRVARDMTALLSSDGWEYVNRLAVDADLLVSAVKASPSFTASDGLTRCVALLARAGRMNEARQVVQQRQEQIEGRSDAAALDGRRTVDVLLGWLSKQRG